MAKDAPRGNPIAWPQQQQQRLHDPYGLLYGNAFDAPRDPLNTPDNPAIVRRDLANSSTVTDWTISGIRSALAAHKVGQFAASAMLVDDVFGDDRVQATLGSRTGALFGQSVIHERGVADTDGACELAWREQWQTIAGQGVLAEIKRWTIMMGFCVAEILYDTSVTPWRMRLKPWHPRYIYYRWDIRRFVVMTLDGPEIIEPGAGKWLIHAPYGIYRGWIHGAIRAIADKWMAKCLAWRDWCRFNERHGMPIILAKVPAAGDAKQKKQFVDGMSTLGQEAVVGLPQNVDGGGYELDLLEARDRAWETFNSAIEAADRSIVLTIKSQNLTTEVNEGSFAAARQHGGTEQVTLKFDDSTFSYDLYEQASKPFAYFNFADANKATRSSWDIEPIEDKAAKAKALVDLSAALVQFKAAGIPYDVEAICREYGVPLKAGKVPSKTGTIYAYHIAAGIPTVNEVRESLGLSERPDGNVPTTAGDAKEQENGSQK